MAPELLLKIEFALALLQRVAVEYRPAAFASSLGAEDMVLADMIAKHRFGIDIFTLDTGRLHAETLNLLPEITRRYNREVRVFAPDPEAVGEYVERHGRDAFFGSVELRKRCCEIRKVEPLGRALAGKRAWITGMRRGQSSSRADIDIEQTDEAHGLKKFNPLADWSDEDVWSYIRNFDVPFNPLHDNGYPSIGCAPCTRPVALDEDPRTGRWWWEQSEKKECGLHRHEVRA
jgi:phosphoadenosine phosphosulfate reductase